MKHLIMGTAGHIDHGKTALIRALTGIDCDTHPQEKERGITINLGFAHLEYSSGESIGIIDVPGHHDFVHTMVGGASSIDFGLLVISADSGVMPQTREHLNIMRVLGVRSGLIALTKIDLADADMLEVAKEEIAELVGGSFLEGAPVVEVSTVSGEGLDQLKMQILETTRLTAERPVGDVFRLFIDRIFTVQGYGNVVTGSVLSGSIGVGDTAWLLPLANQKFRVRGLQRHGQEVEQVSAGDRAAINLVGLERADVKRGMLLADRSLEPTSRIDAQLELFEGVNSCKIWTQVGFYLGTHETQARVHLIDCDKLKGGDTALVQILLERPCVVYYGDRFVIRNSSGTDTIGGGQVIDASPLYHRKRPKELIASMKGLADKGIGAVISAELGKKHDLVNVADVAKILNITVAEMLEQFEAELCADVLLLEGAEPLLAAKNRYESYKSAVLEHLSLYHQANPLEEKGKSVQELVGVLGLRPDGEGKALLEFLMAELEQGQQVRSVMGTWVLAGHSVSVGPEMQPAVELVSEYLKGCGLQIPVLPDLISRAAEGGINEQSAKHVLHYLVEKKEAYAIEGSYVHASVVDDCRVTLLKALVANPAGMTVAEFRDLIGGNRKICLLLFSQYDSEGSTRRNGDQRVITERGQARLA